MKPHLFLYCILLTLGLAFSLSSYGNEKLKLNDSIDIFELDLLPMYGSTVEYGGWSKSSEQIKADRIFLANSDKVQPSRKIACVDYINISWSHLGKKEYDNAMRRCNQAWQLDSTNPEVYVLFAAILNAQQAHEEAIDMLDRAISLTPSDLGLYDLYLSECFEYYDQTLDDSGLLEFINALDRFAVNDDAIKQKVESLKAEVFDWLN